MRPVASAALKEAVRKKTFIVMGIVTVLYLVLWAVLLYYFLNSGAGHDDEELGPRVVARRHGDDAQVGHQLARRPLGVHRDLREVRGDALDRPDECHDLVRERVALPPSHLGADVVVAPVDVVDDGGRAVGAHGHHAAMVARPPSRRPGSKVPRGDGSRPSRGRRSGQVNPSVARR
jgi:hypothetical protein